MNKATICAPAHEILKRSVSGAKLLRDCEGLVHHRSASCDRRTHCRGIRSRGQSHESHPRVDLILRKRRHTGRDCREQYDG